MATGTVKPSSVYSGGKLNAHCVERLNHGNLLVNALAMVNPTEFVSGNNNNLRLWHLDTNKPVKSLSLGENGVNNIAGFSGGFFVTSSLKSNIAKKWNAHDMNKPILEFRGHSGRIQCVLAVSDKLVATGAEDKTIRIWDINTGAQTMLLPADGKEGHTNAVMCLASLDQEHLASGSSDNSVRIWNLRTKETNQVLPHPGVVRTIALVKDGSLAIGCDNDIHTWSFDPNSSQYVEKAVLKGSGHHIKSIVTLENGLLASIDLKGEIRVWDLATQNPVVVIDIESVSGYTALGSCILALPDGRLASGYAGDDFIYIWELTIPGSPEDMTAKKKATESASLMGKAKRLVGLHGGAKSKNRTTKKNRKSSNKNKSMKIKFFY